MAITKIALVTGSSRGLGKEMALALARKGIDVLVTYHDSNPAEAAEVVAEIEQTGQKALAVFLDVSNVKGQGAFFKELQALLQSNWGVDKFDFLVNNAGIGASTSIADATEEVFDRIMNTNLKGLFFLTQKALPLMNDHGSIVNITSGTTRYCGPGFAIYSSLKSGVETFTRYLAKEIGSRGINANIVAPGAIETDFNNGGNKNNPQLKAYLSSTIPLGRMGEPSDIGGIVAFLCSPEAKWINGQRIEATGGINL